MEKVSQTIPFEQYLLDSPVATLYLKIKEYSLQSLHLLIYGAKNFVGFGATKDLCMYFIGLRNNEIVFSSRKYYKIARDETNIVRLSFVETHRAKIFNYINIIYNNYTTTISKGVLTKCVVKLYDTVLININGEHKQIYIGQNNLEWHPTWTGNRGSRQRTTYKSELILGGDHTKGFISTESPLAKAILGKPEGAVFSYAVNGAQINGKILKITLNQNSNNC